MEEKKKRGRPKGSKDKNPYGRKKRDPSPMRAVYNPELPVGCNSLKVSFIRQIRPKTHVDSSDVEEMRRRFEHYLDVCEKTDTKISNLAAYFAIGVDRRAVCRWITQRSSNPERADFFEEVRQICGVYREQLMVEGEIRDAIGIFHQKNFDGLKDQQEHVIVATNPLGDTATEEELKQKYIESADLGNEDTKVIETTMQEEILLQLPETETVEE